jgi:virulence-associated protein VagC
MKAATAKVFNSGDFETIRLLKDFRVKSSTVKLSKSAAGFIVSDVKPSARRLKAFKALAWIWTLVPFAWMFV